MVCERRNPNYNYPQPPIIKKIPTRKLDGSNVNNVNINVNTNLNPNKGGSFLGSNQSPSFGVGGGITTNVGREFTPVRNEGTLPRPVVPQSPVDTGIYNTNVNTNVNTGTYNNVRPLKVGIVTPIKKNPYIQLHDKIGDIMRRRRLLYALTGRRFD